MKTLSLVFSIAITAMSTCAVLAGNDSDAATLNQIASYRQWTRVNPDPVEVSVPVTRIGGEISINSAGLT